MFFSKWVNSDGWKICSNISQDNDFKSTLNSAEESVYMRLFGAADEVAIRLDKPTLRMEPTYLGRTSFRQVTLSNRSDIIAQFKWSKFADEFAEEEVKQGYSYAFDTFAVIRGRTSLIFDEGEHCRNWIVLIIFYSCIFYTYIPLKFQDERGNRQGDQQREGSLFGRMRCRPYNQRQTCYPLSDIRQ